MPFLPPAPISRTPRGGLAVIEVRIVKAVMLACLAAFALLVAFDNVADYDANYLFIQHVLSMDTIFRGDALMYRAITAPLAWHICYAFIIAAEAATGLCFAVAAASLVRHLRAEPACFNRAKRFAYIGGGIAFLLWFAGFMVIAGEWFAMWQSHEWNGQAAAFRFYMTMLGVLIFVNQHDTALA
jgi:predicted small integral membrane protein